MRAALLLLQLPLAAGLALLPALPAPGPEASFAPPTVLAFQSRRAGPNDPLVERVRQAIKDGVTFLQNQQRKPDLSWELGLERKSYHGGWTSLAVLALLHAGVDPKDPSIQGGLAYLRKIPPDHTYVVGLQTMVFCLAGEKQDRERIQRNVDWLLRARLPSGWSYGSERSTITDNSNSQYALLGLHEALLAGARVDPKALREIRAFYIKTQRGGGWGYRATNGPTMTMTTAGLCNLIITGLDIAAGKAVLRKDGSAENCGVYTENEPINRALHWLGASFPARLTEENAVERLASPFYCLYGIERAGRLTGHRYLGGHDWYEIGARFLVDAQKADGSWRGDGGKATFDHHPVVATSFALLFLSKGRTPVLISKLAFGGTDYTGWNNKRSDMRHLVDFASRELFKGRPLAWQTFDVRGREAGTEAETRALAAELLQSPIVFFNGHDRAPRDREREVLREFVANGGFILAENCCGKALHPKFDNEFRKLIRAILPDAELKPLEPEHPVWLASGKFAVSPRDFPLEGVKQGCKTVVIYSPVPLAGYWEANDTKSERGKKAFELGANIIAYATGLEPPRPRLTQVRIADDGAREKPKRGYLQVGQLRHEGDWQPAPKAMRNLMAEARRVGLDVLLKTQPIYPSDEGVLDYRFLYMHGRSTFREKAVDLKHLRFNLLHGGTLLADACCGAQGFDEAFRDFVKELFEGKLKLEPIPVNDELFGRDVNGQAIETVRCRRRTPQGKPDRELRAVAPALEGVKNPKTGRWMLIYSKWDIGCALERHSSPDCMGHDHDSALRLARAAVLYALKR
jgi:hypothetical protein